MIMHLKLEYNTFRAKPFESLSQTYTHYKTLLNELSNDGVKLSKHEVNVGFMNRLPKKWLSFSKGLRNANHTQTPNLTDICGMFVYVDNLVSRRYTESKKALITTPQPLPYQLLSFLTILFRIFKKIPIIRLMRELSKNKGIVAKTFDWDEEEVLDDEEMTQVKVLMALADDELAVGKNHARNAFMDYDHEMILKSKDWVERHNPDSKLPNFNTRRILVPETQAVNECLKLIEANTNPESSKESGSEPQTSLPPLKVLQGASPSSKVMTLTY
ncbi:hypothetical protein Tco_1484560 [Tanacetum coccineum]